MTPPTAYLAALSRNPRRSSRAVDVGVEQNEQILVEVVCGLTFHRGSSEGQQGKSAFEGYLNRQPPWPHDVDGAQAQ